MALRFFGKRLSKKYVRPIRNNQVHRRLEDCISKEEIPSTPSIVHVDPAKFAKMHNLPTMVEVKERKETNETVVETKNATEEITKEEKTETMDVNAISKAEAILTGNKKAPKRRVKVEKKDKGLYERTEAMGVTLITEDNKMLLND